MARGIETGSFYRGHSRLGLSFGRSSEVCLKAASLMSIQIVLFF
jgi:hypothetical protein